MGMNCGVTLESFLATGSLACIHTCTKSAQIAYQEIGFGLLLKFRSLKACHHFARLTSKFSDVIRIGSG